MLELKGNPPKITIYIDDDNNTVFVMDAKNEENFGITCEKFAELSQRIDEIVKAVLEDKKEKL